MTLVQASIADSGNAIVLIADRLLTTTLSSDLPSYEFEAGSPKIFIKNNVGIGFAGSSIYADACISKLIDKKSFDEISTTISDYISKERDSFIEKEIKRLTGVSSDDFFTKDNLPIPVEVREHIYYTMKKYNVNCQSIIAGFDEKQNARIVVVDEDGDAMEATNFNAFPIGSGAPFSKVYFDQLGYNKEMSANESVLFAFEAKKWAQSHTGVGERTDMIVFRKNNKKISSQEIYHDSETMKRLHSAYDDEIKKRDEIRKKLLDNIFLKGGGQK